MNVMALKSHFSSRFSVEESDIIDEWHHLKSLLYTRFRKDLQKLTWQEIKSATKGQGMSGILCLVDLLLSLPPTSVFNEHSFSHMKLIKSGERARLSTDTMTEIVLIKSESQTLEAFDPNEAISRWLVTPSGRKRRPDFMRESQKKQNSAHGTENEPTIVPNVASSSTCKVTLTETPINDTNSVQDTHYSEYESDEEEDGEEDEKLSKKLTQYALEIEYKFESV